MNFLDLGPQYKLMESELKNSIYKVLEDGNFIMGKEVNDLESELASFINVKHCVSCANGTDALQLALMAMDIGPRDYVFAPTFTFFSTAEAISLVGARPVFVDIKADTFNIDVDKLVTKIEMIKKEGHALPKAIISVDLFGLPANYPELASIAKKYNIKLIEDAAQGLGGEINKEIAGSFGDIATTSFFPAKPLGCYGDGGALFTNNDHYAQTLRSLRVHGKGSSKYDNQRIGMNSRLDTIQAAILLVKLKIFKEEVNLRNEIAKKYYRSLSSNKNFRLPIIPNGYKSVWAQYSLLADSNEDRNNIMQKLKSKNIPTVVYYQKPLHLQSAYAHLDYIEGDFPVSEEISNRIFSIPMSPYLSKDDLDEIIKALNSV